MLLQNQNVLLFTRTMGLGGTENVVLQICEILKPVCNKIVVCSSGGVNEDKLKEMGIKHFTIGDLEDRNPLNVLSTICTILKIIKHENITVIHTHHRMAAFYVRLLGLYRSCYFINTSHNTFSNHKLLTRFAYKKAHLIACGEMVKRNLIELFGLVDVTVIHNAVPAFNGEVVIDRELQKDRDSGFFLIGNIGRLSKQKGMEFFISSIPDVLRKHPEARFYIIGSGEDEAKLRALAGDLPISFLGYRNDIQNIMMQLDLVVLSSLWEGLPLTPIEAFSVGKTIVATAVDGTIEIVKDKENGLLVEPSNSQELSNKICWMIEHPDEKKKMEENANESYRQDFSFDNLAAAYVDYYRNLK